MIRLLFFLSIFFSLLIPSQLQSQQAGKIYFVFGSDSSTPGINTRDRTAMYRDPGFELFYSENRASATLMDPAFRNRFRDSNGEPFRFTHWVQGGSLYRYARNTNIPYPSLMTNYLKKKYYEDAMEQFGDEYTYHYHTWVWSDPNGDGDYNWNQTPNYVDSRPDFWKNLAEALIELDMFPVSFRSGWHFMDNDWQEDLNKLLPFSLHNAYPANADGTEEPVNNILYWYEATADWVPFRPSEENYMLPGGNGGWNTRSVHFRSATEERIRSMFEGAAAGIDQVPCIWSHVAETTFIEDFERVFETIERVAQDYPDVEYYYPTAVEAMQAWLKTDDVQAPNLLVTKVQEGANFRIRVEVDEPIFQSQPFLAVKNVYEEHRVADFRRVSDLVWESEESFDTQSAASWAVAVTDSSGNHSKFHQDEIPDDIYIDNEDGDHFSVEGDWQELPMSALDLTWGGTAHEANITENTRVNWETSISSAATYSVFLRLPPHNDSTDSLKYSIWVNDDKIKEGIQSRIPFDQWVYLDEINVSASDAFRLKVEPLANTAKTKFVADAVKLSAYRPENFVQSAQEEVQVGQVMRKEMYPIQYALDNRDSVLKVNSIRIKV